MVGIIYLKKSGFYTRLKGKYKKIKWPLGYYMHHTPEISPDLTVGHLMRNLKRHEAQVNTSFIAYTRGFEIGPFYKEMNKKPKKKDKKPLVALEFSWTGEVDNNKEFGEPEYEISSYVHVSGKVANEDERYGLMFLPMNELKAATILLNDSIVFSHTKFPDRWDEEGKPTTQTFFTGKKSFVLEDILGAFLYEITFSGYPKTRDKEGGKLKKSAKKIDREKCIPMEQVMLELAEKSVTYLQKEKDSEYKTLKLEKLAKEIDYYTKKLSK